MLIEVLEEHLRERRGKAGEAMKGLKTVQSIAHSQAYAQGFYERVSSKFRSLVSLSDFGTDERIVSF